MKNDSIRHEELADLGKKLNQKIEKKSKMIAAKLNQYFSEHRKMFLGFLISLFVFLLIFNLVSYYFF